MLKMVQLKLTEEMHARVKAAANADGRTITGFIRNLIDKNTSLYFKKEEEK